MLAAVGPLQFEVAAYRMEHEFNAPVTLEHLRLLDGALRTTRRRADRSPRSSASRSSRATDGEHLALFPDRWRVHLGRGAALPDAMLDPLRRHLTSPL